jgi:hypothetical protein
MRDIFIWKVGKQSDLYHRLRKLGPGDSFTELPNTVVIEWINDEEVRLEHIKK